MHIKSMSWSTRRISEESVYSYQVSVYKNDCTSCNGQQTIYRHIAQLYRNN